MTYSFTQISQYLACPRRYRHHYLDGWQEKDSRAAMLFGRVFEKALAAYFRREDAAAEFFTEWSAYRDADLTHSGNDSWNRLLQEGFQLLDRFAQGTGCAFPGRGATSRSNSPGRFPNAYERLCQQILRRDGWRCQACGCRTNLQVHHIQLRSQSGDDAEENLITLCADCHEHIHSRSSAHYVR